MRCWNMIGMMTTITTITTIASRSLSRHTPIITMLNRLRIMRASPRPDHCGITHPDRNSGRLSTMTASMTKSAIITI